MDRIIGQLLRKIICFQLLLKNLSQKPITFMSLLEILHCSNAKFPLLWRILCQLLAGWKITVLNTSQIISVFYFSFLLLGHTSSYFYLEEFIVTYFESRVYSRFCQYVQLGGYKVEIFWEDHKILKKIEDLFKILWPSQSIWTLSLEILVFQDLKHLSNPNQAK